MALVIKTKVFNEIKFVILEEEDVLNYDAYVKKGIFNEFKLWKC